MAKKTLAVKIKEVGFWTVIFFILYLIVGYLLESSWLSKPIKLNDIYDLLKDGLGITAAFLAPVAAFVLFSDWRDQHNKQVHNEFALIVFQQFERFEGAIEKANSILIEMDNIVPDESRNRFNLENRPIYLNDPFFEENKDLISSFFKQTSEINEEFTILRNKIRYFSFAINQTSQIGLVVLELSEKFKEINYTDELNDSYSEYLQLLELCLDKTSQYRELRVLISDLIYSILKQLQVKE